MWQQLRLRVYNVDFSSRRGAQRPKQEPQTVKLVREGRYVSGLQQLVGSLPSDEMILLPISVRSSKTTQDAKWAKLT